MTTHTNIIANIHQVLASERTLFDGPNSHILAALLFFHLFGLTLCLHVPFYTHSPVYVLPRFDPVSFCKSIQNHKITYCCVAPPIILFLAKDPLVQQYDFSTLKALTSGAAPLDASLTLEANTRFPAFYIKQGHELTESSPAICLQPIHQIARGSMGVLIPDILAKVVDDQGNELSINQRGELWVKGPNIMKGYLNRPKETADSIHVEGYFHTVDVVTIDDQGNVFIVDRIKELIKFKGFQVAPAELEGLLLKSSLVADCAVIGVDDREQATEVPRAYVVLKQGVEHTTETAETLKKFIADQVSHYKHIKQVVFRDQIPKSATGKILRNILREELGKT